MRAGASRVRRSTALSRQRPRPAASVSAAWSDGVVVGADGGGDAALRGPAVRGVEAALRDDADGRSRVRRREGRGEARDPGTDDHQIRVQFLPQRR